MTEPKESKENENIIVILDENGEEFKTEILDVIKIDENEYIMLMPIIDEDVITDDNAANEAIILRIGIDETGEEILYEIESDDEWEMVANTRKKSMDESQK